MGKIKRVLRCYNCGAVLQTKEPEETGYVPQKILDSSREDLVIYCQKCFEKMKVINTGNLDLNIDFETFKILDDAKATDAIIVWVIDLFAFNGTIPAEIVKRIKKLDVTIIATHRDLFSKSLDDEMFENYIKERFNEAGIKPSAIRFIGNEDEMDIKELLASKKGHDVYIIGSLSSGKTVLINKLLKNYENKTKWPIKTENYPGTTTDVLEIPLSNSSFFYELPDLSNDTSVLAKVEKEVQKIITPKKEIVMTRRFIAAGSSILIGNLACLSVIKGRHQSIRVFTSEKTEVKAIDTDKVEAFQEQNRKKNILKPVSNRFVSFQDFDMFEYDLENDDLRHDIAIEGLCWFSTRGRGQTIRITLPKGAALKESLSKVR